MNTKITPASSDRDAATRSAQLFQVVLSYAICHHHEPPFPPRTRAISLEVG